MKFGASTNPPTVHSRTSQSENEHLQHHRAHSEQAVSSVFNDLAIYKMFGLPVAKWFFRWASSARTSSWTARAIVVADGVVLVRRYFEAYLPISRSRNARFLIVMNKRQVEP